MAAEAPKGIPHDLSSTVGRRAAARARIALPASIETLNGVHSVNLHNLSCNGAMVETREVPAVGSDVILRCGAIDALGVVIWTGSGRCGLAFDEPIPEEEVLSQRRIGEDSARTGMTPDQRKAAEDWANGRIR